MCLGRVVLHIEMHGPMKRMDMAGLGGAATRTVCLKCVVPLAAS